MTEPEPTALSHDYYGHYNEMPHATLDLDTEARMVVMDVLEYQLGPPIAWERDGGMIFVWGDNLDKSLLSRVSNECAAAESDYASSGMYDDAKAANRAAADVLRTEIHPPGEKMVT